MRKGENYANHAYTRVIMFYKAYLTLVHYGAFGNVKLIFTDFFWQLIANTEVLMKKRADILNK